MNIDRNEVRRYALAPLQVTQSEKRHRRWLVAWTLITIFSTGTALALAFAPTKHVRSCVNEA